MVIVEEKIMSIKSPTEVERKTLLSGETLHKWDELVEKIENLYDVDQIWSKGFKDWVYEYKFRRGGKTLCTLYMKKNIANILITLGKAERDKYDTMRSTFSEEMNELYDGTETLHDGKWLWIPIQYDWKDIYNLLLIKRRPNRKSE